MVVLVVNVRRPLPAARQPTPCPCPVSAAAERSRSRSSAAVRNGLLVSSLLRPYLPDVYAPATTTLHQPSRNWSLVLLPPPARVTRPAAPPALARGRGMRRIALSSVPRSGNGWLRRLLEVGSSVATCSTWPEFGTLQQPHNCYFHDHPCGSDARGIEGWWADGAGPPAQPPSLLTPRCLAATGRPRSSAIHGRP